MDDDGPTPDPTLEGGMPLPIRMAAEFPAQLFATPIEDIDPFYSDKKVRTHARGASQGTTAPSVVSVCPKLAGWPYRTARGVLMYQHTFPLRLPTLRQYGNTGWPLW